RMWRLGAATGTGLWIWDLAIDPVGARQTLSLRLLYCVIYLVPVLYTGSSKSSTLLTRFFMLAVLPSTAILFFWITTQIQEGMVFGIGGYMFLQLGGYLLLQSLSLLEIVLSHICVTLIPHLIGLVFPYSGFLHLQYAVLLWPATLMSILAQYTLYQDYRHSYLLQKQLVELSKTDPLTGTQNRRSFQEMANQVMETAQEYHRPLSALMIDADYFKKINDLYGHLAGDKVLQELAHIIRTTLRKADLLCRWGGEEFAVILPETSLSEATHIAERILDAVRKTEIEIEKGTHCRLTVSIGVSALEENQDQASLSDLLARADYALYQAKHLGRNQRHLA
ncbi:MAG: GGDEF domain-containing protein, partial [Thermostichus sp. DG02_5_bins_236]